MEDHIHILTSATKAKGLRYRPEGFQDVDFYVPDGFLLFEGSNPDNMDQRIATEMSYYFPLPNLAKIASRIRFNKYKKQVSCRPTYHWSRGNNSFITIVEFDDHVIWVLKLDTPFNICKGINEPSHSPSDSRDSHVPSPTTSDSNSEEHEGSEPKGDEDSEKAKDYQPHAEHGMERDPTIEAGKSSVFDIELETDSNEADAAFRKLNKEVEDSRRFKIPEIPMMTYHGIVRLKSIEDEIFTAMVAMDYIEGLTASALFPRCHHLTDELDLHKQQKLEASKESPESENDSLDECPENESTSAANKGSSASCINLDRGYRSYSIDSHGNKIWEQISALAVSHAQWRIWYEFAKIKLLFATKFDLNLLRESPGDLDLYVEIALSDDISYFHFNSRFSESKRCQWYEGLLNRDLENYCEKCSDITYGKKLFYLLRWAIATWRSQLKNEDNPILTSFSLKGANVICNNMAEIVSVIDTDKLSYATLGEWAQPPRMVGLNWYSSKCSNCSEEFKDASVRKFVFKQLMRQAGKDCGISSAIVERLVRAFDSIEAVVEVGTTKLAHYSESDSSNFLYSEGFMEHVLQMLATRDVIPDADASKSEIVDRAVAESHDFFKEQELLEAVNCASSNWKPDLKSELDRLQTDDP